MNDRLLGMVGLAVRAGRVSLGVFLTDKALDEGRCRLVVMAQDIGQSNKRRMENKCEMWDVPVIFYSDKATLSHAAGKKDMPVIGILDDGFASSIIKLSKSNQKNNGGAE